MYAPTTSHPNEDINKFYNVVDETSGKPNHYTIVMLDVSSQIGKRTNPKETATGKFGYGLRNERGDTFVVSLSRLSVGCGTTERRQAGYLVGFYLFIRVIYAILPPHGHCLTLP